jgi:hypothetical protein
MPLDVITKRGSERLCGRCDTIWRQNEGGVQGEDMGDMGDKATPLGIKMRQESERGAGPRINAVGRQTKVEEGGRVGRT